MLPFLLRPHLVDKPWAGRSLAARERVLERRIGEAWEVSALDDGSSWVDSGDHAGLSLRSLVINHRRELLGHLNDVPVLIKVIDADEDLSVQVHPGLDGGAMRKEESWWVLSARPGARVLHGLHEHVTEAQLMAAVDAADDDRVRSCVRSVPVRAGALLHIPPGTVHAIGGGIVLLEVQEPADITYRLWDYNRPDANGRLRDLHRDDAKRCARFGSQPPPFVDTPNDDTWIDAMNYRLQDHTSTPLPAGFGVVFAPDDDVVVHADDVRLRLPRHRCAVLPASCNARVDGRVLWMGAPHG
jgi:mannose-6-phosphate isomerase